MISSVSYSVIINGKEGKVFRLTRRLRHGEPLSPFLLLICTEGFSALIRIVRRPQISHLLFVDDCILFREASNQGAHTLKSTLKEYKSCLSQYVNDKSTMFFSTNTSEGDQSIASRILMVRASTNLKRYIGLPNLMGRNKKQAFQLLKDKFKKRIESWSVRFLLQRGKEISFSPSHFYLLNGMLLTT